MTNKNLKAAGPNGNPKRDPITVAFPSEEQARVAVHALAAAGFSPDELGVISSTPLASFEAETGGAPPFKNWIVALGAVAGGVCAGLLVVTTQRSYPIETGGMPIVSVWTDAILVYELTMLGAIISTLVILLTTAKLAPWRRASCPEVAAGSIVVEVVPDSEERSRKAAEVLRSLGHRSFL